MHCLLTISSLQHNEPVTTFYIRLDVDFSSKPILVGMASPVAEISFVLLVFKMVNFPFLHDHGLLSIGSKNRIGYPSVDQVVTVCVFILLFY